MELHEPGEPQGGPAGGWTQAAAALRLGISQPYYCQLESGFRPVPADLALAVVRKLQLSPVALPLPELNCLLAPIDPQKLAAQLAWFAYPGFTHLKKAAKPMNPAAVVAAALANADLDPRLLEALPWILATFHHLNWDWLGAQCRLLNLQNRLGYLVSLTMNLPTPGGEGHLADARSNLERSRLAVEGTLCRESMSSAERTWARQHRPAEAAHWNLITTLTADQLTHAS